MPYRLESHASDKVMRAQSVRAILVSSGIIRGERCFAPGSASIASRRAAKVTKIGRAGYKSLSTSRPKASQERHDASDLTTRQGIFEDSADFASHCQSRDGLSDCGSAQGSCRRLRAAEPRRLRSTMQSIARSAASAAYEWHYLS
jgi:hypothetical protein